MIFQECNRTSLSPSRPWRRVWKRAGAMVRSARLHSCSLPPSLSSLLQSLPFLRLIQRFVRSNTPSSLMSFASWHFICSLEVSCKSIIERRWRNPYVAGVRYFDLLLLRQACHNSWLVSSQSSERNFVGFLCFIFWDVPGAYSSAKRRGAMLR